MDAVEKRQIEGGAYERVRFASRRGVGLAGCWHHAGGRCAVILCHGMESSKEGVKSVAMAEQLADRGIDVLRFDFSYVGESDDRFENITVRGEVEDLAGAWQLARSRVAGPIAVIGSSLGGTVALLYAAEQPEMVALATIAAVAVPGRRARELAPEERERWRRQGSYDLYGIRVGSDFLEDVETLDVPAVLSEVRCPLFLTHGTDDEVVPVGDADAIADASGAGTEIRRYPGADHRFSAPAQRAEMLADIVRWISGQLEAGV